MSRSARRLASALSVAALGLAATAASAGAAAAISYDATNGLRVVDAGASANQLTYAEAPRAGGGLDVQIRELSFNTTIQGGGACAPVSTTQVTCAVPAAGSRAVRLDLGAGDDVASWQL